MIVNLPPELRTPLAYLLASIYNEGPNVPEHDRVVIRGMALKADGKGDIDLTVDEAIMVIRCVLFYERWFVSGAQKGVDTSQGLKELTGLKGVFELFLKQHGKEVRYEYKTWN